MSRLIINADDLGISPGTNRAIVGAFDDGVLTSASLMVNMPATDDAVRLIESRPGLAVGLHVCLTSGRAVLPPGRVPLLVNATGRFRHSFLGLWRLLASHRRAAAIEQIESEARAQWDRARALGIDPGHVDSHQHVHMLPGMMPIMARLTASARVPLRVSREPLRIATGSRVAFRDAVGLTKAGLLGLLARGTDAIARRTDWCLGIVDSGRMTAPVLARLLGALPPGSVELITHPALSGSENTGDECSAEDRRFLASPCRRLEYEALVDPRVRALVEAIGPGPGSSAKPAASRRAG